MSETSTRLRGSLQGSLVASALLAAVAASACGGASKTPTMWQRAAAAAITPMAQRIPTMALEASEWEQGTLDTAQYKSELAVTLAVMTQARDRVAKLPPYPGRPSVDRLYLASMTLYVASTQADQSSVDVADSSLRHQFALMAERIRELGDRVFDQGRLSTGQGLVPAGLAGATVELPSAVPDWTAEGLAAGPPIAPSPAASVTRPPATGGPEVRTLLSELVQAEAGLAMRAAGLVGPSEAAPLQAMSSELARVARQVA